jgi:integrase
MPALMAGFFVTASLAKLLGGVPLILAVTTCIAKGRDFWSFPEEPGCLWPWVCNPAPTAGRGPETKLLSALKQNRHGHRDWLIGLLIYRHGLRVSEACDLRWDDIDLAKRTILVRRLKGSTDSTHYLERDELAGLKRLKRDQEVAGINSAYVSVNERGEPLGRMGIGRMIERAGEAAKLPFAVHVHMLRHSTGYAGVNDWPTRNLDA